MAKAAILDRLPQDGIQSRVEDEFARHFPTITAAAFRWQGRH
jgi:hypothetical protein